MDNMEKGEKVLQLHSSNKYSFLIKNDDKKTLFAILHRFAPILKLISFILIFFAIIIDNMLFILVVFLWAVSIVINYKKWFLIFQYNYEIENQNVKITKQYNYIKSKKILDFSINEIVFCDIIQFNNIDSIKDAVVCFSKNEKKDIILLLVIKNQKYIITVDRYFYSLMKLKEK